MSSSPSRGVYTRSVYTLLAAAPAAGYLAVYRGDEDADGVVHLLVDSVDMLGVAKWSEETWVSGERKLSRVKDCGTTVVSVVLDSDGSWNLAEDMSNYVGTARAGTDLRQFARDAGLGEVVIDE